MNWRDRLGDEATRAYDALRSSVRGAAATPVEVLETSLDADLARARREFDEYRYEAALAIYQAVKETADKLQRTDNGFARASNQAALGQGICLLNLQDDAGADVLRTVDPTPLNARQRSILAAALAQLGDGERARVALPEPPPEGALPDDIRLYDEARGLIALAGDVDLDIERPSPGLRLAIARRDLATGHVGRSALRAKEILSEPDLNPLYRQSAVSVLMATMGRTLFEDDLRDSGVPVDRRSEVLQMIRTEVQAVLRSPVPLVVRHRFLRQAEQFSSVLGERYDLPEAELSDEFVDSAAGSAAIRDAIALARNGDVSAAIELLPPDTHPWRRSLAVVDLLVTAGRVDDAVAEARRLAETYPNRPIIDWSLARLLIQLGDLPTARRFAERAVRELPSRGPHIDLGRVLVDLSLPEEAIAVLEPYGDDDDPGTLAMLAQAFSAIADAREIEFWTRLSRLHGQPPALQLRVALSKARYGDEEEAGRLAAGIFTAAGAELDLDDLRVCGQVVLLAQTLPGMIDVARQIGDALAARFGEDPRAELYRLHLLAALGFPENAPPIEYERLAETGLLTRVNLDEVEKMLRTSREMAAVAFSAYHEGALTFESLCRFADLRPAQCIVNIASSTGIPALRLRTPTRVGERPRQTSLRQATILLSAVEALALERAGALDDLLVAVGDGKLAFFDDVWAGLAEDRFYLENVAQRDEANRLKLLLAELASSPKVRIGDAASTGDAVLVTRSKVDGVAINAIIERLRVDGVVSADTVADAKRMFVDAGVAPLSALPRRIALEPGLAEALDRVGVLGPLIDSVEEAICIGDDAIAGIRFRSTELGSRVAAAELAGTLQRRLARARRDGRVLVIRRPAVAGLPPEREQAGAEGRFYREALTTALAYKEILAQNGAWIRITADFLGHVGLGQRAHILALNWTSESQMRQFWARFGSVATRELTLADAVRIVVDKTRVHQALVSLAELGVQDALSAREMAALIASYGGVVKGRLADLLAKLEAAASSAADDWAGLARLGLADAYANCMWEEHVGATALPNVGGASLGLLDRAWALDGQHRYRFAEQILGYLVLLAIDRPRQSLVPKGDNKLEPSLEAPIGRLWRAVSAWVGSDEQRSSALRRALAYGWIALDQILPDGPKASVHWLPLDVATRILIEETPLVHDVPHPDAVVGILSSLWKTRPLQHRTYTITGNDGSEKGGLNAEQALQAGVALMAAKKLEKPVGSTIAYSVKAPGAAVSVKVRMPPEALLLRSATQQSRDYARLVASNIGVWDGRGHALLNAFADAPKDRRVRRKLARAASAYPCRLVDDDPAYVLAWGIRSMGEERSYPNSLAELRELLSEPTDGLAGKLPHEAISERVAAGGSWLRRQDAEGLVVLGSRAPAVAALFAVQIAKRFQKEHWRDLFARLESCESHSVGQLAQDAAWLVVAITEHQEAAAGEGVRPVERLTKVLEMMSRAQGEPGCVSESERAVLAGLFRVVLRVVGPRLIQREEIEWLAYRTYEWWSGIVDPERQVGCVDAFRSIAGVDDVSTVQWRRARLAAVLYSCLDVIEPMVVKGEQNAQSALDALRVALPALLAIAQATQNLDPDTPDEWMRLGWKRARRCWELATQCALWIAPESFFEMKPEVRLLVLENQPVLADELEGLRGLGVNAIVRALIKDMARVTPEERRVLKQWLANLAATPMSQRWRAYIYANLVVHGDPECEEQLREVVLSAPSGKDAAEIRRIYWACMSSIASRLQDVATESITKLIAAVDEGQLAELIDSALAAYSEGAPESIEIRRSILGWIAPLPRVRDDEALAIKLVAAREERMPLAGDEPG